MDNGMMNVEPEMLKEFRDKRREAAQKIEINDQIQRLKEEIKHIKTTQEQKTQSRDDENARLVEELEKAIYCQSKDIVALGGYGGAAQLPSDALLLESKALVAESLHSKCRRLESEIRRLTQEHRQERQRLQAEVEEANNRAEFTAQEEVPHLRLLLREAEAEKLRLINQIEKQALIEEQANNAKVISPANSVRQQDTIPLTGIAEKDDGKAVEMERDIHQLFAKIDEQEQLMLEAEGKHRD